MNVNLWGPEMWKSLHTIASGLPQGELSPPQQRSAYELFRSLRDLLPCKRCRDSYAVFFELVPLRMFIRDGGGVVYWLYLIHTLVNAKLGVSCNPSLLEVIKKYEARRVDRLSEDDLQRFCNAIEMKYRTKGDYVVSRVIRLCESVNWDCSLILESLLLP